VSVPRPQRRRLRLTPMNRALALLAAASTVLAEGRIGCGLDREAARGARLLGADSARLRLSAARAAGRKLAHVEPAPRLAVSPGPPPAYGSAWFTAELNEVYAVSQTLTDEQRRIADFWADGPGTVTPPGHWNLIAIDLVREAGWSTLRTSRLFSALNTARPTRSSPAGTPSTRTGHSVPRPRSVG
jgi:hypothetical protein